MTWLKKKKTLTTVQFMW